MATHTTSQGTQLSLLHDFVSITTSADNVRVVPTTAAQSALFRVGGYGKRAYLEGEVLLSGGGAVITQTGPELRDDDMDCFMAILHFARGATIHRSTGHAQVSFAPAELLRKLGWSNGGAYYKRLADVLDRLNRTTVRVDLGAGGVMQGSLVSKFHIDPQGRMQVWSLLLDFEICRWLVHDPLSIDWDERTKLSKPMAKWLHAFITSFQDPVFCAPAEELMRLCGSRASSFRSFKPVLVTGLEQMKEVGTIDDYSLDKRNVLCVLRRGGKIEPVEMLAATQRFQSAFARGE